MRVCVCVCVCMCVCVCVCAYVHVIVSLCVCKREQVVRDKIVTRRGQIKSGVELFCLHVFVFACVFVCVCVPA